MFMIITYASDASETGRYNMRLIGPFATRREAMIRLRKDGFRYSRGGWWYTDQDEGRIVLPEQ